MASCMMKQLREKHVSAEIKICLWSPKMDLLAIANVQGQVILYRLSWQQVWILNPPADCIKVSTLAWRPDSKLLAIGYSTGEVYLVNIEDSSIVHQLKLEEEISCLSWDTYKCIDSIGKDDASDPWAPYMYSLPKLTKSFKDSCSQVPVDSWQEPTLLHDQDELSLLSVGTGGSVFHLFAFGLFHVCSYNIFGDPLANSRILKITPSSNLDLFSIFVERQVEGSEDTLIVHVNLKTPLLALRHRELRSLAQKYGQIHSLITYAKHTLTLMEEAWESTLCEMDAKLATYATSVPEGGVAADFLELLVFGHASPDFQIFLTSNLSEKSLKKLRQSIDLCYSTMQRLVVRHLQQVGVTLIFLLSQLEGMSKRKDLFEALGVEQSEVEEALGKTGSYLLKASEMLQAIDSSMKDFHIFVRWVSSINLKLISEPPVSDLSKISQQEMTKLLNFLNDSFEVIEKGPDGKTRSYFRLERAGQYLKNEDLKMPSSIEDTPFTKLLQSNPSLANHKLIFEHNRNTSLAQEHQKLFECLTKMGSKPSQIISKSVQAGAVTMVSSLDRRGVSVIAQCAHDDQIKKDCSILSAYIPVVRQSCLFLFLWSVHDGKKYLKMSSFNINNTINEEKMRVIDASFYSSDTLSLLLQEKNDIRSTSFAQVTVNSLMNILNERPQLLMDKNFQSDITEISQDEVNINSLPDAISIRKLENGSSSMMAVSGPRKVCAIIGENKRRVRIYEMELDEDDEDEDEDGSRNETSSTLKDEMIVDIETL